VQFEDVPKRLSSVTTGPLGLVQLPEIAFETALKTPLGNPYSGDYFTRPFNQSTALS
jgi:hypothetical protein